MGMEIGKEGGRNILLLGPWLVGERLLAGAGA
jgi:hypothetical protein